MDFITFYINLKLLFKVCCVLIIDLLLISIIIILCKTIYNNIILGNKNNKSNNFKLRKLTKEEEKFKGNKNGLH